MQVTTFPITLEESFMLSPKVKHFIFKCEHSPPFHYLPGQFITVHFEKEGKVLRRSYSVANPPEQNNRIEFAAGYVEHGPGTELLFNLKPGDNIQINGPFGRLICKEESPKRYIFVATSTGVTPYRAMIPELKKRLENSNLKIVILEGVQKREDLLYGEEFKTFARQYPEQVIFRPYLSRESANHLLEGEYSGYVQLAFPELNLRPENDMIYLCGNLAMIDDAFEYLKEQGFTTQQIIREKYISR